MAAGLNPTQMLALLAVALCVAATAWAGISEVALSTVRIPLAGVSLLCAFMSPAALPDWRGKAGFVVFMLFTGFVVLKPDLSGRQPSEILDDTVGIQPSARQGAQSLRPGRLRRSGEFGVAAAQLHLRSLPGAPDLPAPAADRPAATTPRSGADSLVLRLDSIVAIHDGSLGTTDWRFDVYVNRHRQMSLGRDIYQDTPGKRTRRFVGAGQPIVSRALTRDALTVQVQGVRSALFGNYMASGRSETFPVNELDDGRARQVVVPVVSDRADHGEFSFFFTVRRV